jgi:hypothetical protein
VLANLVREHFAIGEQPPHVTEHLRGVDVVELIDEFA